MTKYKNTSDQYFLQGSYHCRDAMKAYNDAHILWKQSLKLATYLSGMTKYKNNSVKCFSYHCKTCHEGALNDAHILWMKCLKLATVMWYDNVHKKYRKIIWQTQDH